MMSHNHPHPHFPKSLVRYTRLPGEYGTLEVIAQSAHTARFQLTGEFVDLNRNDAQEMIRVLSAWLAAPVNRVVVDTNGNDTIVVVDERRGAEVVVIESERDDSHVVGGAKRPM